MKSVGGNIRGLWHKLTQQHVVFMCAHTAHTVRTRIQHQGNICHRNNKKTLDSQSETANLRRSSDCVSDPDRNPDDPQNLLNCPLARNINHKKESRSLTTAPAPPPPALRDMYWRQEAYVYS